MSDIKGGNLVEKSRQIVWAKFTDYTAGELRLLEVYLSRINPRDPETSTVQFTLQEYCEFLGLKINSRNLKAQVKHFIDNSVEVPRGDGSGSFDLYPLFSRATVNFEPSLMNITVSLCCNPLLQPVFFDIAERGYVKYRLRYTANMKSQYSILLYSILREFIGRGVSQPEITLDRLREQLGAREPSYQEFKHLRRRVIDIAVAEINEVSDLCVEYDKVMRGRNAVAVKFNVAFKSNEPVIDVEANEVESVELKDVPKSQRPARKPRSGAYENVDWASIAPEMSKSQCILTAKLVAKRLPEKYPSIKPNKKKEAVVNIIENAYKILVSERLDRIEKDPGAYMYSILKEADLDDYATFDDSFLK